MQHFYNTIGQLDELCKISISDFSRYCRNFIPVFNVLILWTPNFLTFLMEKRKLRALAIEMSKTLIFKSRLFFKTKLLLFRQKVNHINFPLSHRNFKTLSNFNHFRRKRRHNPIEYLDLIPSYSYSMLCPQLKRETRMETFLPRKLLSLI